ncbi:MAG TPA: hypothetical protein VFQ53_02075 [Kofleriaceae bacterium]|nr:hypothetical protein [Kofleriaceae bacterium]
MGLAERRASKDFQDKHFPELRNEIHKVAGFPVPIEVNWDQLAVEGQTDYYKEAWTEIFFKPVIEALRSIGRDDMGKEALKGGLKKIEFRNSSGSYSPHSAISFTNGTIMIDHELSNVGDTKDRTKYLIEIVEKGL